VTGEAVAAAQVTGVRLDDGTLLSAPVVVNVAGPWSRQLNALAGADTDFTIGVRALRQEVAHVPAPPGYTGPAIADLDLGVYLRPTPGGGLLIGGTEPECDELVWLDDPDRVDPRPTVAGLTAMVTRASRRLPQLRVPPRPAGIVGVYDVADDWTPIYDRTAIGGYYVAMGTSGNQFKNAPVVGQMMAALIDAVESGLDHDRQPLAFTGRHTGLTIDLGTFSRRRPVNRASTGGVLG
jgi:glycine/D-amino acid oxidase-like deaminating enzyme